MQPYRNLSGTSGVAAYDASEDRIKVRFITGKTYTYPVAKIGAVHLAEMTRRAEAGRGLGTYISQHAVVRAGYV